MASGATGVPGLSMRWTAESEVPTRTRPARMRAWARSRDWAWPRSTRSLSKRIFIVSCGRLTSAIWIKRIEFSVTAQGDIVFGMSAKARFCAALNNLLYLQVR